MERIPTLERELTVPFLQEVLRGSTLHTLAEWSVVCIALCTAGFALAHFYVKREPLPPIISLGAFFSAAITGFHVLGANGLLFEVRSYSQFIPFSFAVGQAFTATVFLTTALIVLFSRRVNYQTTAMAVRTVVSMSLVFAIVAYVIIHVTALANELPRAVWIPTIINRPWDLVGMLLFLSALLAVFPALHRRYTSRFSFALWLSAVPFVAAQFYAVFSATLYDGYFQASLLMKIFGFLVIFAGLVHDYSWHCREEGTLRKALEQRAQHFRLLMDSAFEAIIVFDKKQKIVATNARAEEVFGWKAEEVKGKNFVEVLFTDEEAERCRHFLETFLSRKGHGFERPRIIEAFKREDMSFPAELSMVWAEHNGKSLYVALVRDLTEIRSLQ
ncbi:MAG: PAS domain S-box protein, partial [Bradymonadaceae bacterium]